MNTCNDMFIISAYLLGWMLCTTWLEIVIQDFRTSVLTLVKVEKKVNCWPKSTFGQNCVFSIFFCEMMECTFVCMNPLVMCFFECNEQCFNLLTKIMFEWNMNHGPWVWMCEFNVPSNQACVWTHHGLEMTLTITNEPWKGAFIIRINAKTIHVLEWWPNL